MGLYRQVEEVIKGYLKKKKKESVWWFVNDKWVGKKKRGKSSCPTDVIQKYLKHLASGL